MSNENLMVDEFTLLLRAFNKLVANTPPIEKVKDELLQIKNEAINSYELNGRQKEAVTARVDNYLNGQYGDQIKKIDNRSDYSKSLK